MRINIEINLKKRALSSTQRRQSPQHKVQIISNKFLNIQEYITKILSLIENIRPSKCPLCDSKRRPWHHGSYKRFVCWGPDLFTINIYRFYCPDCKSTMSLLPSFLLPDKTYSAYDISSALFLILHCGKSILSVKKLLGLPYRSLLTSWLRSWQFSSPGIVSTLRSSKYSEKIKGIKSLFRRNYNSKYVTEDSILAFRACMKVAFPAIDFESDKIDFNAFASESHEIRFNSSSCEILKEMQFKLHKLRSSVRLF